MVKPTSDLEEDVDEENAPTCEVCDKRLIRDTGHRVVTWIDDEDDVQHRHFCSEECRSAWDAPE
jgi:hypothetical protein